MAAKKKISRDQRRALRKFYHQHTQRPTQKACIEWFERQYSIKLGQSTVSDSLGTQWQHLDDDEEDTAETCAAWPELERLLVIWQHHVESQGGFTNGPLLQEKARLLWQQIPQYSSEKEPQFTTGWLTRFKRRHNLKTRIQHGEAGSVSSNAGIEMAAIVTLAGDYNEEDIYNMDETGLFWRMLPSKGLSSARQPGFKKNKDRISLVFCCNASGTDRFPLWLIGKAMTPRCLRNVSVDAMGAHWRWNKKAWMTTDIMALWLEAFYRHVGFSRRILLTMDNFSAHYTALEVKPPPPNIRVVFLPPNSTSRFQPLDQGIIQSFKNYYKQKLLQFMLQEWEQERNPLDGINLLFAIRWALESWNHDVSSTTVYNCFRKSTIVKSPIQLPTQLMPPELDATYKTVENSGRIHDLMDIQSFLNPANETEPEIMDGFASGDELLQHLITEISETAATEDDQEAYGEAPISQPPSIQAAIKGMESALEFMETCEATTPEHMRSLEGTLRLFRRLAVSSTQQTTLDSWLR